MAPTAPPWPKPQIHSEVCWAKGAKVVRGAGERAKERKVSYLRQAALQRPGQHEPTAAVGNHDGPVLTGRREWLCNRSTEGRQQAAKK